MIHDLLLEGAILYLLAGVAPLLLSSILGISLAAVQAATQLQEQTVQFLTRVAVVACTLLFLSSALTARATELMLNCIESLMMVGVQ